MKIFRNNMLVLAVLSSALTGCATIESMFEQSAYGKEVQSMMNACLSAQQQGQLSGIKGGRDDSLEFFSDEVDFSDRNNIRYPLTLTCSVNSGGQKHDFAFNKPSSTSTWRLLP